MPKTSTVRVYTHACLLTRVVAGGEGGFGANSDYAGVKLARLLVQEKAMSDTVEVEVPRMVQLFAPVVTQANVDSFLDSAFES